MEIIPMTPTHELWHTVREYVQTCPWQAGPFLGKAMKEEQFTGWERVFVARENDTILGFCTLTKTDCIPDMPYHPYIGYIFVNEQHRGQRISERMIQYAMVYAKVHGFARI